MPYEIFDSQVSIKAKEQYILVSTQSGVGEQQSLDQKTSNERQ